MKAKMIFSILILLTAFGCVKEDLDSCPPDVPEPVVPVVNARAQLNMYVERFQYEPVARATMEGIEERFCDRIVHMRYYLYKDGRLFEEGVLDTFPNIEGSFYTYQNDSLQKGNYQMVVIGNCTKDALSGDYTNPENLILTFPGCADTEDYFTLSYPFTIDCDDCENEFNTTLLRTHGVIRSTFNNVPSEVSDIEVFMDNVTTEKMVCGAYRQSSSANLRFLLQPDTRQAQEEYVMGTFPTPDGEQSIYRINVYRNGETTPFITRQVADTLVVKRNQLIDVITTFTDAGLEFEINLDKKWDGSSSGGEVEVQ